jgi:hypothetical protein
VPTDGQGLTFFLIVAGVFGLLIGSFLNVCILSWGRIPGMVCVPVALSGMRLQIAWHYNISLRQSAGSRYCRQRSPHTRWSSSPPASSGLLFGSSVLTSRRCGRRVLYSFRISSPMRAHIIPDEFSIGGSCSTHPHGDGGDPNGLAGAQPRLLPHRRRRFGSWALARLIRRCDGRRDKKMAMVGPCDGRRAAHQLLGASATWCLPLATMGRRKLCLRHLPAIGPALPTLGQPVPVVTLRTQADAGASLILLRGHVARAGTDADLNSHISSTASAAVEQTSAKLRRLNRCCAP